MGEQCGKNSNLLYKKSTRQAAVSSGAWHLYKKHQYSESLQFTWNEAKSASEEGFTECTKDVYILLDDSGQEMKNPPRIRWNNKGKGKGKRDAADYGGGRRRSRSRDRRLH